MTHPSRRVPPPAASPTPEPAVRVSPWAPADAALVDPIRATVAQLRELSWKRSVPVLVGDSSTFDELLHARGVKPHRLMVGVFVDDTIWLRKTAGRAEVIETIAHELVHALERQHGLLATDLEPSAEAGLARSALHEGVAIAIARAAVVAHAGGHAPRRTIAELGSALEEISLSAPADDRDGSTFEDRFPYTFGGGFAGALYNTGGAALWNAAEHSPPTLLLHVLRPSLYLEGYTEPTAPLAEPAAPAPVRIDHLPRPGWLALSLLGEAAPESAPRWMNDFRGVERLEAGTQQGLVLAFGSTTITAEVAHALRELPSKRMGPNHVLAGRFPIRLWKTSLPSRGSPPHPHWPRTAEVLHPLERDPAVAFQQVRGRTVSSALGLAWSGVRRATRKGLSRSELAFDPDGHALSGHAKRSLVSTMLVRLPGEQPIENGLSLLVQSFVDSEVAALRVHAQPSVDTPAGRVHLRRIDTPEEPVTVGMLPRCNDRYALTFVVFDRELSFEGFRKRLGGLVQAQPDLESSTCLRAIAESESDFTPPAEP